jgi:sulfide:quinone oxidoreductase
MIAFLLVLLLTPFIKGSIGFRDYRVHTPARSRPLFSSASGNESKNHASKKLLIVGGGIGGLSCAFDARHNLRPFDQVTVVSERELFQFTPSNPWVSTRKRTPEDISLPLDDILPQHNIEFVHGEAIHLDPAKNQLKLADGQYLQYDYLIIATGPRLAFDEIPGAKDATVSVCTTPHASHAAEHVDKLVANPGPICVGATQGASCFGPAYEFAFLLLDELKKRGGTELIDKCPMTFITPEPYIGHLGLKGAGESKQILQSLLEKNGVVAYTNTKVDRVGKDHVKITKVDEQKKINIPTSMTMLIPPFRGQTLWSRVPHLTDKNGMIKVNEYQQSLEYSNVFGVGVCVSIPPVDKEPLVPLGAPKTGYMIESQGTAAVKNIRTLINHEEKQTDKIDPDAPPELRNRPLLNGLCITDFGDDGAVFLTLPQYPPRKTDVTLHGKVAVAAKVAFEKYFLHKIRAGNTDPSYENLMLHLIGVDRVTSKKKDASAEL